MSKEAMLAAEKLTEHLQEYLRSGLGSTRLTTLISPVLAELGELRQCFYRQPVAEAAPKLGGK